MPKQREMEIPLLKCLEGLGGSAQPRDIYPRMTQAFVNDLTPDEILEALPTGGNNGGEA